MSGFRSVLAGAAMSMVAGLAWASSDHVAPMQAFGERTVKGWLSNGDLIAAINAQNAKTRDLDASAIDSLDKAWRAETAAASHPMIDEVLARPVSTWLVALKEQGGGVITEIFVMDAKGLNVAQSDMTSDYWQGDEAKWKETFLAGAGAVHVGDVEQDESTQMFQSQLSLPVVDPASGEVIGAITVGVNLDALL